MAGGNQQVDGLPLIPNPIGADVYAPKDNTDYRVRTGQAGGLATLDGTGKLASAQKPTYSKADVGLGNVDNTSDLGKPISTATQNALNLKADTAALASYAPLASPSLTGTPTAPTPATATNNTTIATTAFVKNQSFANDSSVVHIAGTETITGQKVLAPGGGGYPSLNASFHSVIIGDRPVADGISSILLNPTTGSADGIGISFNNSTDLLQFSDFGTSGAPLLMSLDRTNGDMRVVGELRRNRANSTTADRQPRMFVQSADPGAAAATGDLWIW